MIKYTGSNSEFFSPGNISYLFPHNNLIALEGISYCVYVNNIVCGRINLIAKERKLNQGDAQLLEKFTDVLQAYMGLYTLKDMICQEALIMFFLILCWTDPVTKQSLRFRWTIRAGQEMRLIMWR